MKFISFNVNGIRTLKNFNDVINSFNADVICLQEVKASRLTVSETFAMVPGYNSYFSFPNHINNFHGVATFCKDESTKPFAAEEGLSGLIKAVEDSIGFPADAGFTTGMLKELESEGRSIITAHNICLDGQQKQLVVINVYCPRVDPDNPHRQDFQLNFYKLLEQRADKFASNGMHVVILGDINCSHQRIDHCDPCKDFEVRPSRQWMTEFLSDSRTGPKYVDSFRYLHPNERKAFTCWNTITSARSVNHGTRLDYIIVDSALRPYIESGLILQDVQGSDHCPVGLVLRECRSVPATKCPFICTLNWKEFAGKQQSLMKFLVVRKVTNLNSNGNNSAKSVKRKAITPKTMLNYFEKQRKNEVTRNNVIVECANAVTSDIHIEKDFVASQTSESANSRSSSQNSQTNSDLRDCELDKKDPSLQAAAWKLVLKAPPKPQLCIGHGIPCIRRTSKTDKNNGRLFDMCSVTDRKR